MPPSDPAKKESYSISELASEFDISPRAIRFYEEKGLISPSRTEGNQRIYDKRDRARLKLILRGKRFGYSLEEISEMIGMSDTEVDEIEQIEKTLLYSERRISEVEADIRELHLLKKDLVNFAERMKLRLSELQKEEGKKKGGRNGSQKSR